MNEILQAAIKGRYAVGAFNFTALVGVQAAVQAAEDGVWLMELFDRW